MNYKLKKYFFTFFFFPTLLFSQIREINNIDTEINTQIELMKKKNLKKKIFNKKIDSLNDLRFKKYNTLIKYFNENPDKQYFLNSSDPNRKAQSFRESYQKNIDKICLKSDQSPFSTILNFTLTPNGKILNVSANGTNPDFNSLSIIALYKLLTEFEPHYPDKTKISQKNQILNLPVKFNF